MQTLTDVTFVVALLLPPAAVLVAAAVTLVSLVVERRARVRSGVTARHEPAASHRAVAG